MDTSSESPLVSVVLTTYDRHEFLADAIETVVKQTYDEIELIVVDDHSPESPRDIVESAPHNELRDIVFVRHEENRGASAARNTGIETARGELIAFLDDDDIWEPIKIERQVDSLRNAEPNVGAVYTGIRNVDTDRSTIAVRHADREGDLTKEFLCGFTPPFPSVVVRREVVAATGPLDEDLPSWNDREWLLRVSQHCEFVAIDAPLVVSQRGDDHGNLSSNFAIKKRQSYPRVVEKFQPVAREYSWLFARKSYAHLTFGLGYAALTNGEYNEARKSFVTALIQWPFVLKFHLYAFVAATGDRGYKTARQLKRILENSYGLGR